MVSVQSRLVAGFATVVRIRDRQFDPARFTAGPNDPRRYSPPRSLARRVRVEETAFEGWPVFRLTPPGVPAGEVLYLHGGAWSAEIQGAHWRMTADLAVRAGRTFVVPIYPLAPAVTHRDLQPVLTRLYASLAAPVAVAGDSSGAATALTLVQHLPAGVARPANLVLLSPSLDLTFAAPGLAEAAPRDPLLRLDHIRELARRYAGPDGPGDPRVNPINGPLDDLGAVTIFTSDRDLLHAEVDQLRERVAGATGTTVTVHDFPGMLHDWMLMPIPEAGTARSMIAEVLRN